VLVTNTEVCLKCGGCVPVCPTEALLLLATGISCRQDACIDCGDCELLCPVQALEVSDG